MRSKQLRFQTVVVSVMGDLYRYAFWLCRDRSLAEDLVQETFLRAWRSLDTLSDDKAAKMWLFTILRREHARSFERVSLQRAEVDPDALAGQGGYDTSTEAFALRRALATLPADYAEPLVLQVVGGYTAEEIARFLDCSVSAINTRLFRARQKLRKYLDSRERENRRAGVDQA